MFSNVLISLQRAMLQFIKESQKRSTKKKKNQNLQDETECQKKSFGCRNRKVNASRKHQLGKTEFKTESYGCITIFKRKRLHILSL